MKKFVTLLALTVCSSIVFASFPITQEVISITEEATKNFHFGGYLIGLLAGVTGVLVCYIIDDKDMIRSAWYGFGTTVILGIILLAILLIGVYSNDDSIRPYF